MDINKDGTITRNELKQFVVDPKDLDNIFKLMDKDGNDEVTLEEFKNLIEDVVKVNQQ